MKVTNLSRLFLLLVIIHSMGGCDKLPWQENKAQLLELRRANDDLRNRIASLAQGLDYVQQQVIALNNKAHGTAIVSATEKGYAIAQTKIGPFTVEIDRAEQYLDGYKVTLRIGNLSSATAVGANVKVTWGPVYSDPKYAGDIVRWANAQKEKSFSITERLFPGTFNTTSVTLSPAKPDELKTMFVEISTDRIEMHRGR